MVRSAQTTDHKEAVRAFIDKRKAAFSGISIRSGSPAARKIERVAWPLRPAIRELDLTGVRT
jgi:hypothetical protein